MKVSWLAYRPIAHRGLHDEKYPENSLPAFIAAAKFKYPIELDVRLSADGIIMVFHDLSTLRMTGVDWNMSEVSSTKLSSLRLNKTKYSIPTLEDVLQVIDGSVPLLIEVKNEGRAGRLEEMLCCRMKNYAGEFAIQSFNPFSLQLIKKLCPDFHTGQLSKTFDNMMSIRNLILKKCWLNFMFKPSFISYRIDDLPSHIINRAKTKGLITCCWTVRTEDERKKAMKYCDNYIFEIIRP